MDDLMVMPATADDENVVKAFMMKVDSDAAREALQTADELADMIIYHANERANSGIV